MSYSCYNEKSALTIDSNLHHATGYTDHIKIIWSVKIYSDDKNINDRKKSIIKYVFENIKTKCGEVDLSEQ